MLYKGGIGAEVCFLPSSTPTDEASFQSIVKPERCQGARATLQALFLNSLQLHGILLHSTPGDMITKPRRPSLSMVAAGVGAGSTQSLLPAHSHDSGDQGP